MSHPASSGNFVVQNPSEENNSLAEIDMKLAEHPVKSLRYYVAPHIYLYSNKCIFLVKVETIFKYFYFLILPEANIWGYWHPYF